MNEIECCYEYAGIVLIDGVYSMHPTLIDYYDLKIFLLIDHE
jgi:uridine kinase